MSKPSMAEFYQQHIAPQIDHAGALGEAAGDQLLQQMLDAEQKFGPFLRLFVHLTENDTVQFATTLWACICGSAYARKRPGYCEFMPCHDWPSWM